MDFRSRMNILRTPQVLDLHCSKTQSYIFMTVSPFVLSKVGITMSPIGEARLLY